MRVKLVDYVRFYGTSHHSAKLNEDIVREIKRTKKTNPRLSTRTLGRMYGVSSNNISAILRGKIWRYVE